MSISDDEIPNEEQDELRELVHGPTFNRLKESAKDNVLRALYQYSGVDWVVQAFRRLLDPAADGTTSKLPDLTEAQQNDALEATYRCLLLNASYAERIRAGLDAVVAAALTEDVTAAALGVVTAPYVLWRTEPEATKNVVDWNHWDGFPARIEALRATLRHRHFAQLGDGDKTKLLGILQRMHADGSDFAVDLLEGGYSRYAQGVATGETPLLSSPDSHGTTLLAHLDRLAQGRLHAGITIRAHRRFLDSPPPAPARHRGRGRAREEPPPLVAVMLHEHDNNALGNTLVRARALADLLSEVAQPDQHVNQDNRNTCQVTAMLHRTAWHQPSEYARLAVDLALEGTTNFRNGEAAAVPGDAFETDNSTRSVTERLTQSTLIAYARANQVYRGAPMRYFNAPGSGGEHFSDGRSWGLNGDECDRVANAVLLGAPFRMLLIGRRSDLPAQLIRHFERRPNEPVITGIAGEHVVDVLRLLPPQTAGQWSVRARREGQPPLEPGAYYWNPWGASFVVQHGGHPVRIHFGTVEPPSTNLQRSGMRWLHRSVDDTRAVQFIPWASLRALFFDIHLPADEL